MHWTASAKIILMTPRQQSGALCFIRAMDRFGITTGRITKKHINSKSDETVEIYASTEKWDRKNGKFFLSYFLH